MVAHEGDGQKIVGVEKSEEESVVAGCSAGSCEMLCVGLLQQCRPAERSCWPLRQDDWLGTLLDGWRCLFLIKRVDMRGRGGEVASECAGGGSGD